jgi:hypothetical protein
MNEPGSRQKLSRIAMLALVVTVTVASSSSSCCSCDDDSNSNQMDPQATQAMLNAAGQLLCTTVGACAACCAANPSFAGTLLMTASCADYQACKTTPTASCCQTFANLKYLHESIAGCEAFTGQRRASKKRNPAQPPADPAKSAVSPENLPEAEIIDGPGGNSKRNVPETAGPTREGKPGQKQ